MARVTVEDCLTKVENRFALVHAAAKRTKMLYKGSQPLVQCKNKEVVTALREIADEKIKVTTPPVQSDGGKQKRKS